jgi:cysteine desulfurase
MKARPLYFDYNATTPMDPLVLEAMLPWFVENFGNAASRTHSYGWDAAHAVSSARSKVAELLDVSDKSIIFTSGATEAVNLAIKGVFQAYKSKGNQIITVKTEHKAVLDTCENLKHFGAEIIYLDVDSNGLIDLVQLENAITSRTILVSIMWANNETGVIQPMKEIGAICNDKEVLFMSDATQAIGKIPVNPLEAGVHLLCMSAHKLYGPKGVGALWISERNPRVVLRSQIDGGGHERGFRSGTLNVPGIVGVGKAAELSALNMNSERRRLKEWQNDFEQNLRATFPEIQIAGAQVSRLPHVSNLRIPGIPSATWFSKLSDKLAFSTGSACSSALAEPSHVLEAMGYSVRGAEEAVRLSWGRFTKEEEMGLLLNLLIGILTR